MNTLAEWRAGTDFGDHSIDTNPNFVNAGSSNNNAEDYKRTSYPTNGRDGSYASVMGAYITGNEIIGYTDSGAPDLTSPSRSNPQPTGILSSGTTSTTISLDTDETAICKYDTASGVTFDQQQFTFDTPVE